MRQFPAVALLGPRQIGKSTLARLAYPKWPIFDLEDPVDLRRFEADCQRTRSGAPLGSRRSPPCAPESTAMRAGRNDLTSHSRR